MCVHRSIPLRDSRCPRERQRDWAGGPVVAAAALILMAIAAPLRADPNERSAFGSGAELAQRVRTIFAAKCANCHGSQLACPEGHFGYVTDLDRLASSGRLVKAHDLESSKLWRMIEHRAMPPEDSATGPLSEGERAIIRMWIEQGAPTDHAPAMIDGAAAISFSPSLGISSWSPTVRRWLDWLGRFHVVVVHFPIALLIAAACGELWGAWHRRPHPLAASPPSILIGAMAAVAAAALGWSRLIFGSFVAAADDRTLFAHEALGSIVAAVAVGCAFACRAAMRDPLWTRRFRLLLLFCALLVGAAGHFGGLVVHGDDYLDPPIAK